MCLIFDSPYPNCPMYAVLCYKDWLKRNKYSNFEKYMEQVLGFKNYGTKFEKSAKISYISYFLCRTLLNSNRT